jgi:hypothetical protein
MKITEDHEHIWECDNTRELEEEIYERAAEIFLDATEKRSILCCRESANRTILALGISPQSTLTNPLCSGIVTRAASRKGTELSTTLPGFKMNWPHLLVLSGN